MYSCKGRLVPPHGRSKKTYPNFTIAVSHSKIFAATKQPTAESTIWFLFTLEHTCQVYTTGHVICIFRSVNMDGDYFWCGAKAQVWTEICVLFFFFLQLKHTSMDVASVTVVRVDFSSHEHQPSEKGELFYGTLSFSSASTRPDWSVSRTRNGGWYSNAVKRVAPRLCFWCRNQITAETPMTPTTLRMTRADSSALGSEEDGLQCKEGHKYKHKENITEEYVKEQAQRSTYSAWLPLLLRGRKTFWVETISWSHTGSNSFV